VCFACFWLWNPKVYGGRPASRPASQPTSPIFYFFWRSGFIFFDAQVLFFLTLRGAGMDREPYRHTFYLFWRSYLIFFEYDIFFLSTIYIFLTLIFYFFWSSFFIFLTPRFYFFWARCIFFEHAPEGSSPPPLWGGVGVGNGVILQVSVLGSWFLHPLCALWVWGWVVPILSTGKEKQWRIPMHSNLHHNVAPDCTALLQTPTLQCQARVPAAFPLISLRKLRNLSVWSIWNGWPPPGGGP